MDNNELNTNSVVNAEPKTTQKPQVNEDKLLAKTFLISAFVGCVTYFIVDPFFYPVKIASFLGFLFGILTFICFGLHYKLLKPLPIDEEPSESSPSHPRYHLNPLNPASPNYQSIYENYRRFSH